MQKHYHQAYHLIVIAEGVSSFIEGIECVIGVPLQDRACWN